MGTMVLIRLISMTIGPGTGAVQRGGGGPGPV